MAAAFVCASLVFSPSPAAAAAHNARLSADLSDHLSAGSQAIRVIVHGTRAEVDALAVRYNLRIAKYLQSGAVFLVNAGQLAAMRQDDTQDHLSGDIRIQSSVAAADAESIGADQVWAGSDEVRGQTGRGIAVAVIDSGINTRHNALRGRVLVTRDFTGGDGARSLRARHARRGDHRRPGGADGGHARLPRHRAGRVSPQPAGAGRRRVGDDQRRHRGDRLDD